METFLTTGDRNKNIETAFNLLKAIGVNTEKVHFSGYSDTNGVSVYFKHDNLIETACLRVSNHGISNPNRMEETICFCFDARTLRGGFISNIEDNKEIVSKIKGL